MAPWVDDLHVLNCFHSIRKYCMLTYCRIKVKKKTCLTWNYKYSSLRMNPGRLLCTILKWWKILEQVTSYIKLGIVLCVMNMCFKFRTCVMFPKHCALIRDAPAIVAEYGPVNPATEIWHSRVHPRVLGVSTTSPPGDQAVDTPLTHQRTPRVPLQQKEQQTQEHVIPNRSYSEYTLIVTWWYIDPAWYNYSLIG